MSNPVLDPVRPLDAALKAVRGAAPRDALAHASPASSDFRSPAAPSALAAHHVPSDVRRFTHPGVPTLPRMIGVEAQRSQEIRVHLAPGTNVGAALCGLIAERGITSGGGRVLSGNTTHLQYHVIIRAESGDKPYIYGAPIVVDRVASVVAASFTLGRGGHGEPLVHCHGGFVADGKTLGGHFALDHTIAGDEGLTLMLSLYDGIDMVVSGDSETHYSILSPTLSKHVSARRHLS